VPTAAFTTLGCKVNQYETQRILDDFEARGFAIAEINAPADIYVINTCSVTQAAERKSRYLVRKVARQNPESIVVVTGCYAEMAKIKAEPIENVSLVVPNHLKLATLEHVSHAYPHLLEAIDRAPAHVSLKTPSHRTRATIKVQDGCDVFCSFCSIPYTRKVMGSRPLAEVVAEAEHRARQGYRELVVTGVLVGAYGQEAAPRAGGRSTKTADGDSPHTRHAKNRSLPSSPDLADLLLAVAQVPGITRVRLSSIEPTQVTDRLLEAFAGEPKLCRHLHIPLQSGDDGVLLAMNRPYDQRYYLERCSAALERIPDLAITSDIMVGFPGEDRSAFENTLHVVRTVGYARAHLFRYSPRPGTPAAERTDQVPEEEKEGRSQELGAECRAVQQRFIRRFLGRELAVLVEGKEGDGGVPAAEYGDSGNSGHARVNPEEAATTSSSVRLLSGYTSNYIRVRFTGGTHLMGQEVMARLLEPIQDGALGEVGGAHFGPREAPPDADFIPMGDIGAALS